MKNAHKLLRVLLALAVIAGLLPWTAAPAQAETEPEAGSFAALQALLNAAGNGGTVVLDRDYTAGKSEASLSVTGSKAITLDLNGTPLTAGFGTRPTRKAALCSASEAAQR
ncbi:MAG: hypothetical protein E7425_05970 [Ruminococcaceae bacterium]|nr:hypothetical protein [Oscillospiraceae bacterium]